MIPKPNTAKDKASRRYNRRMERDMCRKVVLEREGYRCRACALYGGTALDVHEIVPRSQGGSPFDPINCVALCRRCHRAVTIHDLTINERDASSALTFTTRDGETFSGKGSVDA